LNRERSCAILDELAANGRARGFSAARISRAGQIAGRFIADKNRFGIRFKHNPVKTRSLKRLSVCVLFISRYRSIFRPGRIFRVKDDSTGVLRFAYDT